MKKLTLSILVAGLMVSALSYAKNDHQAFGSSHQKTLVGLCEAVKSDNKLRLHYALKMANVSYSTMQEGLVCNGKDPMTFAMLSGAENNAHLIARRANLDLSSVIAQR